MLVQAAYNAIPYALSPVLGNPLAMAAVNVDRSASLPTQVSNPSAISLGAEILQNIHTQNEVMPCLCSCSAAQCGFSICLDLHQEAYQLDQGTC